MKKTLFVLIGFLIFCSVAKSQYRLEIGGYYGGNIYLGDAAPTLPTSIRSGYGGLVRVNLNSRYAIKAFGYYGSLAAQINKYSNIPGYVPDLTFNNKLWDLGGHLEYSFFPMNTDSYGVVYHASPYIFVGSGLTIASSPVPLYLPNMSFGLGVKWRIFDFMTVGAEWGLRKMFSDRLDSSLPPFRLNNPYGLNSSKLINNDYYSTVGVFATINLWKYKWKCGSSYMYF